MNYKWLFQLFFFFGGKMDERQLFHYLLTGFKGSTSRCRFYRLPTSATDLQDTGCLFLAFCRNWRGGQAANSPKQSPRALCDVMFLSRPICLGFWGVELWDRASGNLVVIFLFLRELFCVSACHAVVWQACMWVLAAIPCRSTNRF